MFAKALILLLLSSLCSASLADNCEAIVGQIEARMRAGGLAAPRLISVDRGTGPSGRVVGSCANGSKQIVLVGNASAGAGAASTGATPRLRPVPADNIITECKDGRVVRGPDCSKPPARPRPAASAASAASAAAVVRAEAATPAAPAASTP